MANYAIIDYATPLQNSVDNVLALMETYLESIDSTTNAVVDMGVVEDGGGFVGWILHIG